MYKTLWHGLGHRTGTQIDQRYECKGNYNIQVGDGCDLYPAAGDHPDLDGTIAYFFFLFRSLKKRAQLNGFRSGLGLGPNRSPW